MDNKDKGKIVQEMFSSIAHRYDLLNLLLSFGTDRYWRTRAVRELIEIKGENYLDIATGTGDIALEVARRTDKNIKIIGVDFAKEMLAVGISKVKKADLSKKVELKYGDAMSLPFDSGVFDGTICAFGVRNFSDLTVGLKEMKRVLKQGGKTVVLEFSMPSSILFRPFYSFYFKYLLPFAGGLISGKRDAYTYLPESVARFADIETMKKVMEETGYKEIEAIPMTLGIAVLYTGINK